MGSHTIIALMDELKDFDGRLYSSLWIFPNLPIELCGKAVLINVVVMNRPVN